MRREREYGYESLAANIVIEAAKDYRKALKKQVSKAEKRLKSLNSTKEKMRKNML